MGVGTQPVAHFLKNQRDASNGRTDRDNSLGRYNYLRNVNVGHAVIKEDVRKSVDRVRKSTGNCEDTVAENVVTADL